MTLDDLIWRASKLKNQLEEEQQVHKQATNKMRSRQRTTSSSSRAKRHR